MASIEQVNQALWNRDRLGWKDIPQAEVPMVNLPKYETPKQNTQNTQNTNTYQSSIDNSNLMHNIDDIYKALNMFNTQSTENTNNGLSTNNTTMITPKGLTYKLPNDIYNHLLAESAKYGIDYRIPLAVIQRESSGVHFKPDGSVNKNPDSSARGYMQLTDDAADTYHVNSFDPYQNITGGIAYIADMLKKNQGDLKAALYSYAEGPGTYDSKHHLSWVPNWYNDILGYLSGQGYTIGE